MASRGSSGAKTSKSTSQSTSKTPSTSAAAPSKPSDYSIYKEWGSYQNFMLSYGLKFWDADDRDEGKAIIQAFKDYDRQVASDARGKR